MKVAGASSETTPNLTFLRNAEGLWDNLHEDLGSHCSILEINVRITPAPPKIYSGDNVEALKCIEKSVLNFARALSRVSSRGAALKQGNLMKAFHAFRVSHVTYATPFLNWKKTELNKTDTVPLLVTAANSSATAAFTKTEHEPPFSSYLYLSPMPLLSTCSKDACIGSIYQSTTITLWTAADLTSPPDANLLSCGHGTNASMVSNVFLFACLERHTSRQDGDLRAPSLVAHQRRSSPQDALTIHQLPNHLQQETTTSTMTQPLADLDIPEYTGAADDGPVQDWFHLSEPLHHGQNGK
ncbi:hypothetical protein HPB51_017701 [Rhipicephalus microplus]|uniref:Uncharacterized protein n=1 Tax=Rhipicephalus microplus TaxID=6941 RepID=A0A9J6E268_RHIMP|nr:hypothetical protein HPB51_017701 [Rhipicephalus microplus]